jgi:hypothetical protein
VTISDNEYTQSTGFVKFFGIRRFWGQYGHLRNALSNQYQTNGKEIGEDWNHNDFLHYIT